MERITSHRIIVGGGWEHKYASTFLFLCGVNRLLKAWNDARRLQYNKSKINTMMLQTSRTRIFFCFSRPERV